MGPASREPSRRPATGITISISRKIAAISKRSRRVSGNTPNPTAPPKFERLAENPRKIRGATQAGISRVYGDMAFAPAGLGRAVSNRRGLGLGVKPRPGRHDATDAGESAAG